MSFKNKVVLVTGASSGIGAATAIEFTKQGANVAIVGRNVEKLQKVTDTCTKLGRKPLTIRADVGNDDEAKSMVEQVIKTFGKLDVLVNNAGFMHPGSILGGDLMESYDKTMNVNLRAVFHITALAAPLLLKTKGNIINISSVVGSSIPKVNGATAYSASKAALNHFTRCAAKELAGDGVRVNTVSPGPVATDFLINSGLNDVKFENIAKDMPLQRCSEPVEMADVIMFLASDRAVGITGSEFVADNGYLIS